MTVPVGSDHSAAKAPGRISNALLGLFMKRATVAAIEDVSDRFRLVTLQGAALKGASWAPGHKIHVAMGSGFVARTYTPMDWDAAAGSTRMLGYAHGGGPGSTWLCGLRVGDECDVFGPRSSLDSGRATSPLTVFGDETSIGLAYALASTNRLYAMSCCFEVNDIISASQVLSRLGLEGATLVAKRAVTATTLARSSTETIRHRRPANPTSPPTATAFASGIVPKARPAATSLHSSSVSKLA